MNHQEICAALKKARGLLVSNGWQILDVGVTGGPMCIMGAINAALHGHPEYEFLEDGSFDATPVASAMAEALQVTDPDGASWALANWNNAQKTVQPVLDGIDKTITALSPAH